MGAFLLFDNKLKTSPEFTEKLKQARNIFEEKRKLPISGEFQLGNYTLLLYGKRFYETKNYLELENGDIVASTGSPFYKGQSGEASLKKLHYDFTAGIKIENNLRGHFFIVIMHKNDLLIFRDYDGIYPVYVNSQFSVISSSFLVSSLMETELNIAKDEMYEYLFNGHWIGNQTLFKEINLLREKGFHKLPQSTFHPFLPVFPLLHAPDYQTVLDNISESILAHFKELISAFGKFKTGLSGGYDSRLILASLLKLENIPELFVNGTPGSTDIVCATNIARKLNLDIREVRFYEDFIVEDKASFIMNRFYMMDGLGTGGIFDNYSDLETKLRNPAKNNVLLNGAGGEIYREAWNLPNRRFLLGSYIKARYDKFPFGKYLKGYSKKEYLKNLERKTKIFLDTKTKIIKRIDIERLHETRYKAIHFIMTVQQQLYPFVMPFYEAFLIEQSFQIPLKFKYNAKLNKDLIRKIYPELAGFMSAYGYNFEQKIPIGKALNEFFVINISLNLRPLARKFKKSKKLPVKSKGVDLLSASYVDSVLPKEIKGISKFIHLYRVDNDPVKSRALSVELLFNFLKINQGN